MWVYNATIAASVLFTHVSSTLVSQSASSSNSISASYTSVGNSGGTPTSTDITQISSSSSSLTAAGTTYGATTVFAGQFSVSFGTGSGSGSASQSSQFGGSNSFTNVTFHTSTQFSSGGTSTQTFTGSHTNSFIAYFWTSTADTTLTSSSFGSSTGKSYPATPGGSTTVTTTTQSATGTFNRFSSNSTGNSSGGPIYYFLASSGGAAGASDGVGQGSSSDSHSTTSVQFGVGQALTFVQVSQRPGQSAFTYNSSTVTSNTTATFNTTVTSTRVSSYRSGSSTTSTALSSTSTITTTIDGSFTTSSVDSITTTATTNTSCSTIVYLTASAPYLTVDLITVIVASTTDWLWSTTTTGTGQVASIAASFTSQTFYYSTVVTPSNSFFIDFTDKGVTYNYTVTTTNYNSSSKTISIATTSSSTYSTGAPHTGNTSMPPSTTSAATVTYATFSVRSITYSTSVTTTRSSSILGQSSLWTNQQRTTGQNFIITSYSGGTTVTIFTTTDIAYTAAGFTGNSSTGTATNVVTSTNNVNGTSLISSGSTTASGATTLVTSSNFTTANTYPSAVTDPTSSLSYLDATIGPGFQVYGSLGAGQSIGTNVSAPSSLKLPFATAFPATVDTPILSQSSDSGAITLIGAVPTTLQNYHTSNVLGGVSWNSTVATTVSAQPGLYSATVYDGTTTSTTTLSFDSTVNTFVLNPGYGLAVEPMPRAYSKPSTALNPLLAFTAFPST